MGAHSGHHGREQWKHGPRTCDHHDFCPHGSHAWLLVDNQIRGAGSQSRRAWPHASLPAFVPDPIHASSPQSLPKDPRTRSLDVPSTHTYANRKEDPNPLPASYPGVGPNTSTPPAFSPPGLPQEAAGSLRPPAGGSGPPDPDPPAQTDPGLPESGRPGKGGAPGGPPGPPGPGSPGGGTSGGNTAGAASLSFKEHPVIALPAYPSVNRFRLWKQEALRDTLLCSGRSDPAAIARVVEWTQTAFDPTSPGWSSA